MLKFANHTKKNIVRKGDIRKGDVCVGVCVCACVKIDLEPSIFSKHQKHLQRCFINTDFYAPFPKVMISAGLGRAFQVIQLLLVYGPYFE